MDGKQIGAGCCNHPGSDAVRRLDANVNYLHATEYLRRLLSSGVISKEQAGAANRYYADLFHADIVLVL